MKKEPKLAPSRLAASSHQTKRRSDKAYWERVGRDKRRARRAGNRDKTNKAHNRQRYRLNERLAVEQIKLKSQKTDLKQFQGTPVTIFSHRNFLLHPTFITVYEGRRKWDKL